MTALIMTNAHVVSWAKQIRVMRHQDPRPVSGRGRLRRAMIATWRCLKVLEDEFL
jgi:hypothetical protein